MKLHEQAVTGLASSQKTDKRYSCAGESDCQVTSAALLGGRDALMIQHHGERYILRLTRAGKLILTK